jgi:hypothetical protein
MKRFAIAAMALFCLTVANVEARGGGGGRSGGHGGGHSSSGSHSRSSAPGPGTGSKSQAVTVRGHNKKDGTHVAAARRTTPDRNFRNNYSTKGNTNVATGKPGTRIDPPKKRH